MKKDLTRRDFAKATGIGAAAIAAGGGALTPSEVRAGSHEADKVKSNPIAGFEKPHTDVDLISGMREQGKGLKCYVEADYAPLKACIVGNPSAVYLPNPDTWEYANILAKASPEMTGYMRKHAGRNLKESDPEMWEKMAMESDALAKAYRHAGV